MFGKLIVKSKKDKEKAISIYLLNSLPENQKQNYLKKLYEQQDTNDITISCGCGDVEMRVYVENGFYYIESDIGCKSKHDKRCFYSASLKQKEKYEKSWLKEIRLGNYAYIPKLDNLYFSKKEYQRITDEVFDDCRMFNSEGDLTFRGFIIKLNLLSWDNFVKNNNRLPYDIKEITRYVNTVAVMFYPERKQMRTLYDYFLSEQENFKSLPQGSKRFFYGELKGLKKQNHNELYLSDITMKIYNPFADELLEIFCDGFTFQQALEKNVIKPSKDNNFIVSGMLVFDKDGEYNIETLELLPVSNKGLFVENEKERLLFNLLNKNNRLFKKEHYSIPEYANKIPCAVLIDTKNLTILEIEPKRIDERVFSNLTNEKSKLNYVLIDDLDESKLPNKNGKREV